MSDYSRFIAWDRRCLDRGGYGMTPGDTLYLGLRDYNQPYPMPNGMEVDTRQPQDCESWRRRVAKAKRDIEQWNAEQRVASLAESITDNELEVWFNAIKESQLCPQK